MKKIAKSKTEQGIHYITAILMTIVLVFSLTGCGTIADVETDQIVAITSTYPLYEFTSRIGGQKVSVSNLLPPGADAHDYEPSVKQMMEIAKADVFIYNGAGFELWIDKLLDALEGDHKLLIINGTEGLSLREADDHEDDEHHEDNEHRDSDDHNHGEYDPHVWLDPQLALMQAEVVFKKLAAYSPENAKYFEQNYNELKVELKELDHKFSTELKGVKHRKFIVSHAGYGYIAARYNLEQIAITGIHPGSEPSTREIQHIVDFLRERDNRHVFFETTVSNKTAQVIADEGDAKVLVLHPLENLTAEDIENGETYFTIMHRNLDHLLQALGN